MRAAYGMQAYHGQLQEVGAQSREVCNLAAREVSSCSTQEPAEEKLGRGGSELEA